MMVIIKATIKTETVIIIIIALITILIIAKTITNTK